MSAAELIQYLTWIAYLVIFVAVVAEAIRHPRRTSIDIALLFTMPALIISISIAAGLGLIHAGALTNAINTTALLTLGALLLRLVADFAAVPRWLEPAGVGLLIVLAAGAFIFPPTGRPILLVIGQVLYLVSILLYTSLVFFRESRQASGVTRRRMWAVAVGSLWLWALFAVTLVGLLVKPLAALTPILIYLAGLGSGLSFLLGFAPPTFLRRAWQEPELRAFLARAATLPRLPDTPSILRELERGATTALGASGASIGLWDEAEQVLRFGAGDSPVTVQPTEATTAGRAFLHQRPMFTAEIHRDNPYYAEAQRAGTIMSALAAPITAGPQRLGILAVTARRAPIFAEEDLALVQLLAAQAAVILESRALIDEAARVQAREEVTRLKEDFLSAAAHDLKTPLTTLVAQTELLERRALRTPDAPADLESLRRLKKEAHRLKALVLELLDAARAEQGRLVGERQEMDLTASAQEVCARYQSDRHPCRVEAAGPRVGIYDPNRILQLLENLVENAVKYSPDGGAVQVRIWQDAGWNHLTVTDQGIGVPKEDLANVFERFHRGSNVDDRRFVGMGLGLFICRGIVEQHGGRIWVETHPAGNLGAHAAGNGSHPPHRGSTFHVELPALVAAPAGRSAP